MNPEDQEGPPQQEIPPDADPEDTEDMDDDVEFQMTFSDVMLVFPRS